MGDVVDEVHEDRRLWNALGRKAIAPHDTSVSDASWDGGANLKNLGDSPTEAQLRKMHAWRDPEGDPTSKSSYKLPHHLVTSGGVVGAAASKACSAAIGALNGGRGGVDIPDADRKPTYNHVAKHLRDGGMEPAELNSFGSGQLRRYSPVSAVGEVQVRKDPNNGDIRILEGHASVFDVLSQDLGGYSEIIRKGAFIPAITHDDVVALFNHDTNFPLGRNTSDSLRLAEDRKGLAWEARANMKNPRTASVVVYIEDGLVTQCSFSFTPGRQRWLSGDEIGMDAALLIWEQLQVAQLWDVSPVIFPAYLSTDVVANMRNLESVVGFSFHDLQRALLRMDRGIPPSDRDMDAVATAQKILRTLEPVKPTEGRPTVRTPEGRATDQTAIRRSQEQGLRLLNVEAARFTEKELTL